MRGERGVEPGEGADDHGTRAAWPWVTAKSTAAGGVPVSHGNTRGAGAMCGRTESWCVGGEGSQLGRWVEYARGWGGVGAPRGCVCGWSGRAREGGARPQIQESKLAGYEPGNI